MTKPIFPLPEELLSFKIFRKYLAKNILPQNIAFLNHNNFSGSGKMDLV